MARSDAVWGIDVGQCALKAMRCHADEDAQRVIADAFDYIEYPKILSQPDADPVELISDALKQFLSRNSLRGDRVAISVSGQSGLARFIKLPPVEAKKIPDIVRYEARQQIPFDLNDVIWDYQRMGGGSEEEGFALETEIGLFAMKRDAVFRTLDPFQRKGIEVDVIQLTPLSLYNYVLFDQLRDLPPVEEYDPENPPESVVVISLGTDSTDLVVTNGYRVWQRSVPIGGNHFTKALTKELKLTFAKAEHLKRNATTAQDPKAVFQAMRPVFNDLLAELQRSLGYFTSIERAAKIGRVVALGNAMKLPGLRRYLSQSLGYEVERIDQYHGLTGAQVLAAPAFADNSLSFAVCFGLVLQGLEMSGLKTNLLPGEIIKDRLIRQKKPWALAAAAVLLLGCTISFASYAHSLGSVEEEKWRTAESMADGKTTEAARYVSEKQAGIDQFGVIDESGNNLVANIEGRILWLELLRAVNECLPQDPDGNSPEDISERNQLHIANLECQYLKDLSTWFECVERWYEPPSEEDLAKAAAAADAAEPGETTPPEDAADAPAAGGPVPASGGPATADAEGEPPEEETPSGPGWIVKISGHHFHNLGTAGKNQGAEFVRNTLIKNLHTARVKLPDSDREAETWTMQELGIRFPVLIDPRKIYDYVLVDPSVVEATARGVPGRASPTATGQKVRRFDFVVHFCWQPITPTEREEEREE